MINCLRHPIREHFLAKAVLGSDLLLWLFWLPVMLRMHTIPILLKRLARSEAHLEKMPMELREAIGIGTRVCNLRVFRSRIFPKPCLRQSLTLYRTLNQMGYPVEIHFGVRKDDKNFQGHSWVTIHGESVADTAPDGHFKAVYSYPEASALLHLSNL
jgi:Transglutaminase-like superfamily